MRLHAEEQFANPSSRFLLPPCSSFLLSEMHLWHDQLSCISSPCHSDAELTLLSSPFAQIPSTRVGPARVFISIALYFLIDHI